MSYISLKSFQIFISKTFISIINFIRKNLVFGNKTFIMNTRQGLFGVLKFILRNIETEFKDLQPYVNYIENGETSLDILNNFLTNQKEIIDLFKKSSAFKFNEIMEREKEEEKKVEWSTSTERATAKIVESQVIGETGQCAEPSASLALEVIVSLL